MTAFSYEALDKTGRCKKGVLSADSMRLARKELLQAGLSPLKIKTVHETTHPRLVRKSMQRKDVVSVTRQIATLVESATPVEEAFAAVAAQIEKPTVKGTLLTVRARVMEGWRLSDALAEHPRAFNNLHTAVIAAGEASGDLGRVMSRLADMQEKNREMGMKAVTALVYPTVLALVAFGVISGLMVFVVPRIVEQFDNIGATLPLITRIVIGVSSFLHDWGLALLAIFILSIIIFWRSLRVEAFKLQVDRAILRFPLVGKLARNLDAARFARTLSTLFVSGAPLLDCLRVARRTVLNIDIKSRLNDSITALQEGASLSNSLRKSDALPLMLIYMIAAGERSGELPKMLDKAASHMEQNFDSISTVTLRLLEPLIIVTMGIVILAVVLAILVPILQLNTFAV